MLTTPNCWKSLKHTGTFEQIFKLVITTTYSGECAVSCIIIISITIKLLLIL